ncbi:MAG: hypothetical protein EZS28_026919 [Streblomastix strix]|uniref:Uncharacterized protein n=1 Tax=Streblomastix strix TaxID=222440 RepID=A0A5J4V5B0_9EUKA|nr:MAG: hypothetical protein EZS28_026919 [Streblomastix strix]
MLVLTNSSPTITSPRLTATIHSIIEVDSSFEKKSQPVAQIQARRRSSIFEETIMPDPLICRLLLDVISEDEHMAKESAHFILSGLQLIRVVAYTYEVSESQVEIIVEDEICCSKFCHDGTETITDIAISNVNILTLDVDKVNLLRDSYKICLQKVRKISLILDLEEISSRIMRTVSSGLMQVLSKVTHINNKIDMINNAPAPDVYTKTEENELLDEEADKTDLDDYYTKSETYAKVEATPQIGYQFVHRPYWSHNVSRNQLSNKGNFQFTLLEKLFVVCFQNYQPLVTNIERSSDGIMTFGDIEREFATVFANNQRHQKFAVERAFSSSNFLIAI